MLRFYQLGAENFWIDEIFSIERAGSLRHDLDRFWNIANRPLSLFFLHFALPFGTSEFLLRTPFAILSILDVGALFLLSRELVERRVALRATLFLAVLPLHVWYAQEVRWYSQWALLATVSSLALVRLWKTGRIRWWVCHTLTIIFALYTFVASLYLVLLQFLTAWLLPDRGRRGNFRTRVAITAIIAALVALPYVLNVLGLMSTGRGGGDGIVGTPRATTFVVLPYLFFAYVSGYTVGPTVAELHDLPHPRTLLSAYPEILLYYLVFVPVVLAGLWSLRGRRECAALLVPWVVGLPLLIFATAVVEGQTFNVRYTFAAVPGFALLLSLGVESLGRWRLAGTIAVLALFGASLVSFYGDPRYDKEHHREATRLIRTSPSREEPIAVVGQGLVAAMYYGKGLEFERLIGCGGIDEDIDRDRAPAVHLTELRSEPAFWLMVSRDWEHSANPCLDRIASTHEIRTRSRFPGVDVFLLSRR